MGRWLCVAGLLVLAVAGCASASPGAPSSAPSPCGSSASPPATYRHVVVVMEENRTWSEVGGVGFADPAMPYLHALAQQCTTFVDWAETNPGQNSLTQYVGLTSGADNPRTVDGCSPGAPCLSEDDNIFRQVRVAGGTARSYVDGATTPCSADGNAVRHVPALYFVGSYTDGSGALVHDRDFCGEEVRPLDELDVDHLPTFALVTPDLCHDGHDCGNDDVDAFARTILSRVLASPAYAAGDTAVMVLYDEDRPVPNLIIAPTAVAGPVEAEGAGHAAMLKTWEQMLGLPVMAQPAVEKAISLRAPATI